MKKIFVFCVVMTVFSITGLIVLLRQNGSGGATTSAAPSNVSVVDGKQVIEIRAKGGYAPRNTVAKANMPTMLNIKTGGTYDCSSAISIPSIGYQGNLPPSGVTAVEIPPQQAGTTITGTCAMGMYHFTLAFN